MAVVPCLRFEHMSETEKRAYVLADNKLARNAGWEPELLAAELGALLESPDLDFDIGITGFSIAEVDLCLEEVAPEEPEDPADETVATDVPRRRRAWDIWQLGTHRLICGNALDAEVVAQLMDGESARMVFSDPPYKVTIDSHVRNSGKVQHREFAMASGEMKASEFTNFLQTAFRNMADHSMDGAIHFLCMDWRHISEIQSAAHGI